MGFRVIKSAWFTKAFFIIILFYHTSGYCQPRYDGPSRRADSAQFAASWELQKNNYELAIFYQKHAVADAIEVFGQKAPIVQYSTKLADIYSEIGDYTHTDSVYYSSLKIAYSKSNEDLSTLGRLLVRFGFEWEQRNMDSTEKYFYKAVEISKKLDDTILNFNLMEGLLDVYLNYGKLDSAEYAIDWLLPRLQPAGYTDETHGRERLGTIQLLKGMYKSSIKNYLVGIDSSFTAKLNRDTSRMEYYFFNRNAVNCLEGIAIDDLEEKDTNNSLKYLGKSLEIANENLNSITHLKGSNIYSEQTSFGAFNDDEIVKSLSQLPFDLTNQMDLAISFHIKYFPNNPIALKLAINTILQRKNLVFYAASRSNEILKKHFAPNQKKIIDSLVHLSSIICKLKLTDPNNNLSLGALYQIAEEQHIKERTVENTLRFDEDISNISIDNIMKYLPDSSSFLEFTLYHPFNSKATNLASQYSDAAHYAVYIIHKNGNIKWVDLGEASIIDSIIQKWRDYIAEQNDSIISFISRGFYNKIMAPIMPFIRGSNHLLISPDSKIDLIPFSAFVMPNNNSLIQQYKITYITNAFELIKKTSRTFLFNPPIMFANPDYGAYTSEKQYGTLNQLIDNLYPVHQLPATQEQVNVFNKYFPNGLVFQKDSASASNFQKIDNPIILDIATHGFYVPLHQHRLLESKTSNSTPSTLELKMNTNYPLLRCGLEFADANEIIKGNNKGILLGLDIANMNLSATELVVLSACETGLGDWENNTGVYSLQEAFTIAGAKSEVVSLWSVDDSATCRMVSSFYMYLSNGYDKAEAIRRAQLDLYNSRKYHNPYYWAGLIQVGDWSKIDFTKIDSLKNVKSGQYKEVLHKEFTQEKKLHLKGKIRCTTRFSDKVYVGTDLGYLYGISMATDSILWTKYIPVLSSSPLHTDTCILEISVDKNLIAVSTNTKLFVFDTVSQKPIWKFDTVNYSSSIPVFHDDKIFWASIDVLYAFDAKSGKIVWKSDVNGIAQSINIIKDTLIFVAQDIFSDTTRFISFNLSTGKTNKVFKFNGKIDNLMFFKNEFIFNYWGVRKTYEVLKLKTDLDSISLMTNLNYPLNQTIYSDPNQNELCFATHFGIEAFDYHEGETMWRTNIDGFAPYGSPIVSGNSLYFNAYYNSYKSVAFLSYNLNNGDTAIFKLPDTPDASAIVCNSKIAVSSGEYLYFIK